MGSLTGISCSSYYTETLGHSTLGGTNYYHGLIGRINTSYGFSTPTPPLPYSQDFVYDKYGRLTQADASSSWSEQDIGVGGETQYDANGNITLLKRGSNSRGYQYVPGKNIPQQIGSWSYNANATGNITASGSIGSWNIFYDPFTQLPMQYSQSCLGVSLQYDGKKERVYKRYSNCGGADVRTLYLHGLNDYPLMIKDNNNNEWVYIYGPTGLVAVRVNNTWYYIHKDHLGSTKLVVNESFNAVCRYEYDPYGKIVNSDVNPQMKHLFTSQEQESDISSSFWNFRARAYDSEIGMFYAPDPAKDTYSPFGYVGGNPISFIDPTGKRQQMTRADWTSGSTITFGSGNGGGTWGYIDASIGGTSGGDPGGITYLPDGSMIIGSVHLRNDGTGEVIHLGNGGYWQTITYGSGTDGVYGTNSQGQTVQIAPPTMVWNTEVVWVPINGGNVWSSAMNFTNWIIDQYEKLTGNKVSDLDRQTLTNMSVPIPGMPALNPSSKIVLKDGFYEANGFKISEYYYNRLWETGRGAPFVTANEVMNGAVPQSPHAIPGFYNYYNRGWHIVYSPSTGEIWHMQPMGR